MLSIGAGEPGPRSTKSRTRPGLLGSQLKIKLPADATAMPAADPFRRWEADRLMILFWP